MIFHIIPVIPAICLLQVKGFCSLFSLQIIKAFAAECFYLSHSRSADVGLLCRCPHAVSSPGVPGLSPHPQDGAGFVHVQSHVALVPLLPRIRY